MQIFLRECAQRAHDKSAEHGGLKAFAADVANDDEHGTIGERKDLIEIAADFAGGPIASFKPEPGRCGKTRRYELCLNPLCGLHFGGKPLVAFCRAAEA